MSTNDYPLRTAANIVAKDNDQGIQLETAAQTGYGSFARLPLELRIEVWKYLIPSDSEYASGPDRLAVLRTSRSLYQELLPSIYGSTVLQFQISPQHQRKICLMVKTNAGLRHKIRDLEDAVYRGYGRLPYDKLQALHIDIDAASEHDPGQVIHLCFDDTDSSAWLAEGELHDEEDFLMVLAAFYEIRRVRKAEIRLPQALQQALDPEQIGLVRDTEKLFCRNKPFGASLNCDDPWNDDALQEEHDELFTALERQLDTLRGRTADALRLDRCSKWYSQDIDHGSPYGDEVRRMFREHPTSFTEDDAIYVQGRYAAVRPPNPCSLSRRFGPYHDWCNIDYDGDSPESWAIVTIRDAFDAGLIQDGWSRSDWRVHYPDGIPAAMFYARWEPTCFDEDGYEAHLLRDRRAHWTTLMDCLQQGSMGA